MAKKKQPKNKQPSGKLIVLGISTVILLVFAILATITVGVNSGWQIPGIGEVGSSISSIISSQGSGSYTTTTGYQHPSCTSTSCPSGSVLPTGSVAFNMQLVAAFSDGGPNSTISSQQGLPGLDAISIGGRPLKFVDAQSIVGYISSLPVPAGSTAEFKVNETSFNEHSQFVNWRYYDYTTGFVKNNTVALFLLPDFPVSGSQVFADACTSNSTGGVSCNLPNGTIQSRRIDWNVLSTVIISTPNLAVLPLTYSNLAVAAADFDGLHETGCVSCGGPGNPTTPPPAALPATFTGQSSSNVYEPTQPTSVGCVTNCGPIITIVGVSAPYSGSSIVANSEVIGLTKDSNGKTTSGSGTGSSGTGTHHTGYGNCLSELPGFCVLAPNSLLPVNYVPLTVGSLQLVNPWALMLFAIIWVALAIGIIGFAVLTRRWLAG